LGHTGVYIPKRENLRDINE